MSTTTHRTLVVSAYGLLVCDFIALHACSEADNSVDKSADVTGTDDSDDTNGLGDYDSAAGSDPAGSDETSAATEALVGGFTVNLVEASEPGELPHVSMIGRLYDREPPPTIPTEVAMAEGGCELWVPTLPFCDPPCSDGVCTEDGVCTPFASRQNAGTIKVEGLGKSAFELEPVGVTFTYQTIEALPFPPCEEGAEVRVSGDGFDIRTPCIAPLVVPNNEIVKLREGQAAQVSWDPPGQPDVSRIIINIDISHHGGFKGEIQCNVEDTGSFQVPEPLVTALIGLGVAGFPTIMVNRVSTNTDAKLPDVSLTFLASIEREVDVGFTSCVVDDDCPDGMTCDTTRFLCM